ncbi:pentraxin fusion protein [Nematolebias whitei]|uniref:pentraxin fusion protein n=1 Tax=Nematolebias whitei TaxID=451745 RepID=UPI0018987B7E|nr:pentraxin fusion protein [Nematolebias whitei]
MKVVLFVIALSAALTGSLAVKSLVFPRETATSYVEVIPRKPLNLKAFTLCMLVATELRGDRAVILFAYRTQDTDELNVWRERDGSLSFYLSGNAVTFQVPQLGALQTHLCVIWDYSSGAGALFMNGRKSLTKIYKSDHAIRPGGRIVLGQDPDALLGGFDINQSFVGEISDVNMWDSVLPKNNIQDMFCGKRIQRGTVIDWETAQLKVNGEVTVIDYKL